MAIVKTKYSITSDKGKTKTYFMAKLDFFNDTAPKDRKEIRDRISYNKKQDYDYRYYSGKKDIATYLVDNGNTFVEHSLSGERNYFQGINSVKYNISPSKRNLSIKITAKADKEIPKEEIIDLKELDKFLDKGEYNYKLFWQNAGFNKKK